jgi:uncharacterized membrane-anchored protein
MRWKLAMAWVAAHVLFFAAWAVVEQGRLSTGYPIHVRTSPVDPRDLLRGQYLRLAYEFTRVGQLEDTGAAPKPGDEVWFVLRSAGEFHVPRAAYSRRPAVLNAGEVAIVGRAEAWRTLYGIEEYYVPEGSPTPAQADTTVRLRVGKDGKPRIETVLVKGIPWP